MVHLIAEDGKNTELQRKLKSEIPLSNKKIKSSKTHQKQLSKS